MSTQERFRYNADFREIETDDGSATVARLPNSDDANRHGYLLAAAPDLLAACEEAHKTLRYLFDQLLPLPGMVFHAAIAHATAERVAEAMRKARGEGVTT